MRRLPVQERAAETVPRHTRTMFDVAVPCFPPYPERIVAGRGWRCDLLTPIISEEFNRAR